MNAAQANLLLKLLREQNEKLDRIVELLSRRKS